MAKPEAWEALRRGVGQGRTPGLGTDIEHLCYANTRTTTSRTDVRADVRWGCLVKLHRRRRSSLHEARCVTVSQRLPGGAPLSAHRIVPLFLCFQLERARRSDSGHPWSTRVLRKCRWGCWGLPVRRPRGLAPNTSSRIMLLRSSACQRSAASPRRCAATSGGSGTMTEVDVEKIT